MSTYLRRTCTGGNQRTATFSAWVKKAQINTENCMFLQRADASNFFRIRFNSDQINFNSRVSGTDYYGTTAAVYRDPAAWYHIVLAVDTTQSTAADRFKLYVNSTQQTLTASSYPGQNADLQMNVNSMQNDVGGENGSNYFKGIMAHVHWADGTAYTPSTFGETDSTSGIWKPKSNPTVTYGTNGFFLKFANSGSLGLDSSGNTNNFTVTGSGIQTQDAPSNNFATWNPLSKASDYNGQNLPINGNTTFVSGETSTNYPAYWSTLGVSAGKWYFECKMGSSGGPGAMIGVSDQKKLTSYFGSGSYDYGYFGYDGNKYVSGSASSYGNSYGNNDIVGCAVDLDNNKLYFSKNGTFQNSGVPTSGSTGTGAISIADASSTTTGFYFFTAGDSGNSDAPTVNANFGNGYFGTTAVASSNSDGNGYGLFEYSVPTGYYALCTKNIKLYGG